MAHSSRKFQAEDPDDILASNIAYDADPTLTVQLHELNDALQRLPQPQRNALLMVHVVGLPYGEVARQCGVALGTIKSRIARARESLHAQLGSPLAC